MAVALVSAITRRPVYKNVAMTGEITLRGKVLAVGAVRDKVLAAQRSGVKKVIIPRDNENDLLEVPEQVRKELDFLVVTHVDEIINAAPPPGEGGGAGAHRDGGFRLALGLRHHLPGHLLQLIHRHHRRHRLRLGKRWCYGLISPAVCPPHSAEAFPPGNGADYR